MIRHMINVNPTFRVKPAYNFCVNIRFVTYIHCGTVYSSFNYYFGVIFDPHVEFPLCF